MYSRKSKNTSKRGRTRSVNPILKDKTPVPSHQNRQSKRGRTISVNANLNNKPYLSIHDFSEDPPLSLVKGYGQTKTVWHIPGSEGTGSKVIINATKKQDQIKEKAKDDYKYTKILHDKYGFFSEVT